MKSEQEHHNLARKQRETLDVCFRCGHTVLKDKRSSMSITELLNWITSNRRECDQCTFPYTDCGCSIYNMALDDLREYVEGRRGM